MKSFCARNLNDLRKVVQQIPPQEFSTRLDILSGSSIGQHLRHILEFYLCLLEGTKSDVVNYELRKRDLLLETDPVSTLRTIDWIITCLPSLDPDRHLTLAGTFSAESDQQLLIQSTYGRELAYNLEHSIHHQALIKIGLRELQCPLSLDPEFGVAPATLKYYAR